MTKPQEAACRLVEDRILKLETEAYHKPDYKGTVVTDDMLLVINDIARNLQIYDLRDGKLISTSQRLESWPMDICLLSNTEVAICLWNGIIVILSVKSIHNVKLVKTLDVSQTLSECFSVAKLNKEKLVVSGWNEGDKMMSWCVVSITDGNIDSIQNICKEEYGLTHLAIKENTIYISCRTFESIADGVYVYEYDIFNPQKPKILYGRHGSKITGPIMTDRGYVYVCDFKSNKLHQLTHSGQLVPIHIMSSSLTRIFYDVQKRLLYTTSYESNEISVYKMEYSYQPGVPMEILKMDDIFIQLFKEALKNGKENVYGIRVIVVGNIGVGKTTLVKRLLGDDVNISERLSTEVNDVSVNYCDASLSTHTWTRRPKDSEQDFNLQRLMKCLNLNCQTGERVTDINSSGFFVDDLFRQMLKVLQEYLDKSNQDKTKHAQLTICDVAGPNALYTTHPMLLTRHAIYLLVLDASRGFKDEDQAKIWMNSIHTCASPDIDSLNSGNSHMTYTAKPPPVILVGTHVDQITQPRMGFFGKVVHGIRQIVSPVLAQQNCSRNGEKFLQEIHSCLKRQPTGVHLVDEYFAIDNTVVDSKLENLKRKIVEVASQQPYWGELIPSRWFLLEQQLMRLKEAGVKVISRITVEDLNRRGPGQIKESEELDVFLLYLHEAGTIIYFSIEVLRDNVVLDPVWLTVALKSLINALPNLLKDLPAGTAHHDITQTFCDFEKKGILTLELVDAIWTKESHPEFHEHKSHILMIMEQLHILVRPRVFNDLGEKEEDYFLAPCMLRQESPAEVIHTEQDPTMVTTPEICCVFTGKYLPSPIFHRLLAACVVRWPIAKKESENLIFYGCCVFDLDLFHRLTLYMKSHVVCAKITRLVFDEIKTPDGELCSKVRRFITLNLDKITSDLGQNLKYELQAEIQTWRAYQGHAPDMHITHEHMNHARLCVALVTVCGKAMREILRTQVPDQYTDIFQAILVNQANLTTGQGRGKPLLNPDQSQLVFPSPQGQNIGQLEQFDNSLLYILIRNISSVRAPSYGWGNYPPDHPQRDRSLGASVERIRSYRNHVSGHSPDGKISSHDFQDYWKKFEAVLLDIEAVIGGQGYSQELEKQRRQVISVYEAC